MKRRDVLIALGAAGLPAVIDWRGHPDLFGRKLEVTETGSSLRANKLRSFLTMFGILWVMISVVVLSAIVPTAIAQRFFHPVVAPEGAVG